MQLCLRAYSRPLLPFLPREPAIDGGELSLDDHWLHHTLHLASAASSTDAAHSLLRVDAQAILPPGVAVGGSGLLSHTCWHKVHAARIVHVLPLPSIQRIHICCLCPGLCFIMPLLHLRLLQLHLSVWAEPHCLGRLSRQHAGCWNPARNERADADSRGFVDRIFALMHNLFPLSLPQILRSWRRAKRSWA